MESSPFFSGPIGLGLLYDEIDVENFFDELALFCRPLDLIS
jgi:hypothetical protein